MLLQLVAHLTIDFIKSSSSILTSRWQQYHSILISTSEINQAKPSRELAISHPPEEWLRTLISPLGGAQIRPLRKSNTINLLSSGSITLDLIGIGHLPPQQTHSRPCYLAPPRKPVRTPCLTLMPSVSTHAVRAEVQPFLRVGSLYVRWELGGGPKLLWVALTKYGRDLAVALHRSPRHTLPDVAILSRSHPSLLIVLLWVVDLKNRWGYHRITDLAQQSQAGVVRRVVGYGLR